MLSGVFATPAQLIQNIETTKFATHRVDYGFPMLFTSNVKPEGSPFPGQTSRGLHQLLCIDITQHNRGTFARELLCAGETETRGRAGH